MSRKVIVFAHKGVSAYPTNAYPAHWKSITKQKIKSKNAIMIIIACLFEYILI